VSFTIYRCILASFLLQHQRITTDCAKDAAIMMQRALYEFNFKRIQMGKSAIAAGIGIHHRVSASQTLLTAGS